MRNPTIRIAGCALDCGYAGRRIFLSSQSFTGDMGTRAGADLACETMAYAAGLRHSERYRALLADASGAPNDFVEPDPGGDGLPFILPTGLVLAASYPELIEFGPGAAWSGSKVPSGMSMKIQAPSMHSAARQAGTATGQSTGPSQAGAVVSEVPFVVPPVGVPSVVVPSVVVPPVVVPPVVAPSVVVGVGSVEVERSPVDPPMDDSPEVMDAVIPASPHASADTHSPTHKNQDDERLIPAHNTLPDHAGRTGGSSRSARCTILRRPSEIEGPKMARLRGRDDSITAAAVALDVRRHPAPRRRRDRSPHGRHGA